jgi:hypothetical protein
MQTVKQLGDRLAQAGHPLKPCTIQTALGELEAAGLAAGSQEGNGRARYWSPTTPTRMATAPATVNRAMVGRGHGMTRLANVLDRGLAEPAHGTSQVALVRLVVTDLRTAPRKNVLTSAAHHHENQAASLRCCTRGRRDGRAPRRSNWSRGRVPLGALISELLAAQSHAPLH